jgi:hypothetical protein
MQAGAAFDYFKPANNSQGFEKVDIEVRYQLGRERCLLIPKKKLPKGCVYERQAY